MELKNEEHSRIFAAYWGAKIIEYSQEGKKYDAGIVNGEWMDRMENVAVNAALLLFNLSAISDEHAIAISDIATRNAAHSGLHLGRQIISDLTRNINLYAILEIRNPYNFIEVIDKLREWGYNVGYGKYSPADLVNMGIVIETYNTPYPPFFAQYPTTKQRCYRHRCHIE